MYAAFSDNPIWHFDLKGDSSGNPALVNKVAFVAPAFSLRIGESGGPWGPDKKTSMISLIGNNNYYNSTPNGPPGGISGLLQNILNQTLSYSRNFGLAAIRVINNSELTGLNKSFQTKMAMGMKHPLLYR